MEKWQNLKDYEKFLATEKTTGEKVRCQKENSETVFIFAKGRKRYGYRYGINYFLEHYEIFTPKTTEGEKWKNRLKKAIAKMEKSGLWQDVLTVYKNLYNFISYEEKNTLYNNYWNNDKSEFIKQVKAKYPFMVGINEKGDEYFKTDYIFELSDCKLKSMYFGKYYNEEIKNEIKNALKNNFNYSVSKRVNYDVSFDYIAETKKAWYSEEYINCGNGHYYLAIDENTAIFCEND